MDPASETQKHQGSKKAASHSRGKPGLGKMSAQKQPLLCGPTPCSTMQGLAKQKKKKQNKKKTRAFLFFI